MYTLREVKQRLSRQPYFCHFLAFDFAALKNTLFTVSVWICISQDPPFACYPSTGCGVSEDTGVTCSGVPLQSSLAGNCCLRSSALDQKDHAHLPLRRVRATGKQSMAGLGKKSLGRCCLLKCLSISSPSELQFPILKHGDPNPSQRLLWPFWHKAKYFFPLYSFS